MFKRPEFYDYIIIGGGISGLSSAYYIQKRLRQGERYAVLESADRWGGKISTFKTKHKNYEISFETGADCIMSTKPAALELVSELGLSSELIKPDQFNETLIYQNNKLQKLPEGLMLMLPTKLWPFARTGLLSLSAKLRVLADLLIPVRKDSIDESVADFIERRMGKQMLTRIVEPLIGSIFGANPYKQSVHASFPHLVQMEKKHKSLLIAVIKNKLKKSTAGKEPPFYSFKGGMSRFIELLKENLKGDCFLNSQVIDIKPLTDSKYKVILADGKVFHACKIIITSPACEAARILDNLSPQVTSLLRKIRQLTVVNLNLLYQKKLTDNLPSSSGILVAKSADRLVNAVSLSTNKYKHSFSDNFIQLRVSLGGYRRPNAGKLSDQQILQGVSDELKEILSIKAEPDFYYIKRWNKMMPQYDVGHPDLLNRIRQTIPKNIYVTGASYHGTSLPDCVFNAQKLAAQITS